MASRGGQTGRSGPGAPRLDLQCFAGGGVRASVRRQRRWWRRIQHRRGGQRHGDGLGCERQRPVGTRHVDELRGGAERGPGPDRHAHGFGGRRSHAGPAARRFRHGLGYNYYGELGIGSTADQRQPVQTFPASLPSGPDGDGLATPQENAAGCDPYNFDTNGDGLLDGSAVAGGLSCSDLDMDDDGLVRIPLELQRGTPIRSIPTRTAMAAPGGRGLPSPWTPRGGRRPEPDPGDHHAARHHADRRPRTRRCSSSLPFPEPPARPGATSVRASSIFGDRHIAAPRRGRRSVSGRESGEGRGQVSSPRASDARAAGGRHAARSHSRAAGQGEPDGAEGDGAAGVPDLLGGADHGGDLPGAGVRGAPGARGGDAGQRPRTGRWPRRSPRGCGRPGRDDPKAFGRFPGRASGLAVAGAPCC